MSILIFNIETTTSDGKTFVQEVKYEVHGITEFDLCLEERMYLKKSGSIFPSMTNKEENAKETTDALLSLYEGHGMYVFSSRDTYYMVEESCRDAGLTAPLFDVHYIEEIENSKELADELYKMSTDIKEVKEKANKMIGNKKRKAEEEKPSDETNKVTVKILKMTKDAKVPVYATDGASCCDVYTAKTQTVKAFSVKKLSTKCQFEIPKGYGFNIRSRSSVFLKNELEMLNATIDSDYRGEVKIIVRNRTDKDIIIEKETRIAQIMLEKIYKAEFVEVSTLETTERGTSGFGSTGESALNNGVLAEPNTEGGTVGESALDTSVKETEQI